MTDGRIAKAEGLLDDAVCLLRDAVGGGTLDDEIAVLRTGHAVERQLQRLRVDVVAEMRRTGVFTQLGKRPETALADLLGIDHTEARQIVTAAEQAVPRTGLQGQVLPPLLPATAQAFAAGTIGLRHVDVIARLLSSPTAGRLPADYWADAETQLATAAGDYAPTRLRAWGHELLELLDQDGAQPDDREPADTNEMFLRPHPNGRGGTIHARFDDAAMYEIVSALIDAKAAPLTTDDTRPLGQRQAEAMAEIFGWVAAHGDTTVAPAAGGRRPQVNVLIRLEDLQNRARAACLDFGGTLSPTALRRLCCDACITPIVLDGTSQPLDVGRMTRTIPDGLRRAITARDRGCAHPGCTRPPSWCDIHHITPWEHGGPTTLSNLIMLCVVHHREMHTSGWTVRIAPDGQPEFFPPTWVDPQQRPRRNPRPFRTDPGPPT